MFTRENKKAGEGIILVMVLFLVILLSTMIIAFFFVINSEMKIVRNYQCALEAKYTAEAGIETAIEQLRNNCALNGLILDNIQFPPGSDKYFRVFLENSYPYVTITSTGEVRNYSFKKGLRVLVMISGPPQPIPYKIRVDSWSEL